MQTTSTFRLTFHRHDSQRGEGRIMIEHISATDFDDAIRCAGLMRRAMKDADPDRTYRIASVSNDGLTGTVTASGWMTQEEFTASIEVKK